ncbi:MAG: hypothetical protein JNJ71_15050 [Rubrivivax sp.]|nr:hypothetical protein [Rubrivivax sp.]
MPGRQLPARRHARHARRALHGVSLIEALVALTVMSFGMLAVVGVQASLRLNSDVAKQRSEGVRIAQEAMERWRAFAQVDNDPDGLVTTYADIASTAGAAVAGYTTNTEFTLQRTVTESADQAHKAIRVTVSWVDRNNTPQSVTLDSHVARIEPALTASVLSTPAPGGPGSRPLGRHPGIPIQAKDMGGGLSAFKPPAEGGGTTAWVFNNTTGMIQGICTVAASTSTALLSAVDIASCKDNALAHLLSGFVRFATSAAQPTAADAENPTGLARNLDIQLLITDSRTPTCFDDAPATSAEAAARTAVRYYCAIPANATRTWEGYATVLPQAFSDAPASAWAIPAKILPEGATLDHQLCRYTPAATDEQRVSNAQHPWVYRTEFADPPRNLQPLPMPPLVNQNFLVILIANTCPTDVPANPAAGDFVNSNTLVHKPLP